MLRTPTHAAQDLRSTLLAIAACLQQENKLQKDEEDATAADELATWISRSIAPVNRLGKDKDEDEGQSSGWEGTTEDDPYDAVAKRCLATSEPGVTALAQIWQYSSKARANILDKDGLVTLIALSDPSEPWSTPTTAARASELLSSQLSTLDTTDFLVESILKAYLQPLFYRSRPSTVTATGRKAEFPEDDLDRKQGLPDDSRRTKPWKYSDLRSIPVLAWAIDRADEKTMVWPLYTPPLLTLIDDPSTRVRARGLRLTAAFLRKLPAPKLRATGLASVFEDAVFPTLSYLPSLTPEDESVALLDPALDALLVLAGKLAAEPERGSEAEGKREERRLLDKILRQGVLSGYFHCPENAGLVEVLVRKTGRVVEALGVASVKHVKDLVPMLKGVIADPFASARPETVAEGVKALQVVIQNCWPRLVEGVWAEEVLVILVLGWVGLLDHDGGKGKEREKGAVDGIREELKKTAQMLAAVAETGGVDLAEKVKPLVAKEPGLAEMFNKEGRTQ